MLEVKFYDTVDDSLLKFAVIISQSNGKWVFCKHKERDTYEAPGGHREVGEDILETAKRELQEETGAIQFDIKPICVYSVTGKNSVNETDEETFGLLCFAEITEFSGKLESEMKKVELMDELPKNWTYPLIQPKLIEKYLQIEKQSYSRIQLTAKQTIEYIKKIIKPGMNLLEIRKFCEEKLLESGADSFWYWDVGDHLGRAECCGDELGDILAPLHNVDLFAAQLFHNSSHTAPCSPMQAETGFTLGPCSKQPSWCGHRPRG